MYGVYCVDYGVDVFCKIFANEGYLPTILLITYDLMAGQESGQTIIKNILFSVTIEKPDYKSWHCTAHVLFILRISLFERWWTVLFFK